MTAVSIAGTRNGSASDSTEVLERDDHVEVSEAVRKLGGVETRELMDMQLAAFEWANQVSREQQH